MYHSILVGQDASSDSREALELAIWIAGVTRAHLTLIHLHGRKLPSMQPAPIEDVEASLQQRLEICRRAAIQGSCRLVERGTARALLDESKWHDLVVVGKHGENRPRRKRGLGSLATELFGASPVPVLIADPAPVRPNQLLVAFDGTPDACAALRIAASLAQERGLKLHVVGVVGGRGGVDQLDRAREYLEDRSGLASEIEQLAGKPDAALVALIQERDIHLTFLPALDRSFFGHKLISRVALETASSIAVPKGQTPPVY
jgi:nucleotide-binding universal stress UspA family protein